MNETLIYDVIVEIAPILVGRMFGKIFQLSPVSFAVDFRLPEHRYLFISVEPREPRFYLIERKARELEKSSVTLTPFFLNLRKHLGGARLANITQDANERIARFHFEAMDELGARHKRTLVAQLTGRSANLFLLDDENRIIDMLRPPREHENVTQKTLHIGEIYQPPRRIADCGLRIADLKASPKRQIPSQSLESGVWSLESKEQIGNRKSEIGNLPIRNPQSAIRNAFLSAALDEHFQKLEAEREFNSRIGALASNLSQEISKRRKLQANLERDLAAHGRAETHKRLGDLLLANIATAKREGNRVSLIDYFAEDAPTIEIEVDEKLSLPEAAARMFERYAKAKRAAQEISERLQKTTREIETLEAASARLVEIKAARNLDELIKLEENVRRDFHGNLKRQYSRDATRSSLGAKSRKGDEAFKGARRYRSSDGYEILVGRAARDNDMLTFRVARSNDIWLHAADYPGSHVVIRNTTRGDVPHRTIIEAAQLAAFFSQAKQDAKVGVNYTPRKFVSKPKGAAPGLVRLASFRTLLVEPRESAERIL